MYLSKFSYKGLNWELSNLELNQVNLIVAKNSTGKSRTLLVLDVLIKTITQQVDFLDHYAHWSLEFLSGANTTIKYDFTIVRDSMKTPLVITCEQMWVDDVLVLSRDRTNAWIYNDITATQDAVFPPANKLILHVNRDVKKFPYLENIVGWAESSYGFRFASIIPYSKYNHSFSGILNLIEDVPELFELLNEQARLEVQTNLNRIGYGITHIISRQNGDGTSIYVKEKGVDKEVPHWQLSQGMFRALSMFVFIQYLLVVKKPAMVLVDDLCEGLDYDRAKKMGSIIFDLCLQSNIQLVATSNDAFLMDAVDIKYWNVLVRNGSKVTAINYNNSPKLFDNFKFTGLSNFDFFSSDFIKPLDT